MQIDFEEWHTLDRLKLERNLFKRECAQSIRTFCVYLRPLRISFHPLPIHTFLDGSEISGIPYAREKREQNLANPRITLLR